VFLEKVRNMVLAYERVHSVLLGTETPRFRPV
jgi:hypothetical protein